jgi:hypothetical protein
MDDLLRDFAHWVAREMRSGSTDTDLRIALSHRFDRSQIDKIFEIAKEFNDEGSRE